VSIRKFEQQNPRVESGVVQFGNDWCGIFFRGDDAFAFAMALEAYMQDPTNEFNIFNKSVINSLIKVLMSCDERAVKDDKTILETDDV